MQEISYQKWLELAQIKCKQSGVELAAPLIFLENVLDKNKSYILSHSENLLNQKQLGKLESFLNRRLEKEPLAYILNNKEFYGRDFYVDENVLIPRPESELLIDKAKEFFQNYKIDTQSINQRQILDIGSGSGCLTISLALEIPNSFVHSYEISNQALEVAKKNAKNLDIDKNILFSQVDITNHSIKDKEDFFDCIVSNPPYIPEFEYLELDKDVKNFEPRIALTSGVSGLEIIEKVLIFADTCLSSGGLFMMEHGYNQNIVVQDLANRILNIDKWHSFESIKDYANNWRIFKAIKK